MGWKQQVLAPAAGGVLLVGGAVGLTSFAGAQSPAETPAPTETATATESRDLDRKRAVEAFRFLPSGLAGELGEGFTLRAAGGNFDWGFDLDGHFGDEELTPEEIAAINAETEALVAYLAERGFTVGTVADESGLLDLDLDLDFDGLGDVDEDALWDAIEAFEREQFAAEVAGWTDEEKAEWNAEVDEIVAFLAGIGITVETEEIAPGVRDVAWDAAFEAVLESDLGELLEQLDGLDLEGLELGDFELGDFDLGELLEEFDFGEFDHLFELTPELIDELNAETDALVEHLRNAGFDVTVETDEDGLRYFDFEDAANEEQIEQAIDEFFRARFAEEVAAWSDEERAEWNAMIDETVAELAKAGITVTTQDIIPGVRDIAGSEFLEELFCDDHYDDDEDEDDGQEDAAA